MEHYLYIIKCNNFAKVGISCDLESRLKSFESFNPYNVKLVSKVKYHNKKLALMCETELHKILTTKGFHEKFEWFNNFEETLTEFFAFQEKFNPEVMKKISNDLFECSKILRDFLGFYPTMKKKSYTLNCFEKISKAKSASYFMNCILTGKAIDINIANNDILSFVENIVSNWDQN